MAQFNRLSARRVQTVRKPGRHADGGNLYLVVNPGGSKQWVFLYRWHGKPTEIGLGAGRARELAPLSKAREIAARYRALLAEGINPKDAKRPAQSASFGHCCEALIEAKRSEWRHPKSERQWRMTLREYGAPLWNLSVNQITTDHVLMVLKPHWQERQVTAMLLRGRIETVLDWARVKGLRDGENPARWRGHLALLLPTRRDHQRDHHEAMPYVAVPAFVADLRKQHGGIAALALEVLIFTAARLNEVLAATWSEFDLDNATWTVPASRMKMGKEHRVPLSPRVVEIVGRLRKINLGDFVFPGSRQNRPISGGSLTNLMTRMNCSATRHGFRASFKTWAAEVPGFRDDLTEAALAHTKGKLHEAYLRGELFDRRREVMIAWANYVAPPAGAKIVRLRRGR
jgi:integrase